MINKCMEHMQRIGCYNMFLSRRVQLGLEKDILREVYNSKVIEMRG